MTPYSHTGATENFSLTTKVLLANMCDHMHHEVKASTRTYYMWIRDCYQRRCTGHCTHPGESPLKTTSTLYLKKRGS